ncbi:SURF1 family cytochrome oxidase biogenesis protein [Corynebacterium sp. H113]|uniref:SURF1 family cytochrome oxidase biogenesis protein n=1 Tax=Corynebacterium sp. H113 TaxID=3133419 RepID=UPI0030982C54
MNKLRQFLTPGWVLIVILAIAFSYIAFTILAPWQLGKNATTKERNQQLREAFEREPVDIAKVLPAGEKLEHTQEWTRVTAQGQFLPDAEVLLRNRPVDGDPVIQVLTAFETDAGTVYLVNRGYLPPPSSGLPDVPEAPKGSVTLSGFVRANERTPEKPPIAATDKDPTQVYGINTQQVAELVGDELNKETTTAKDSDSTATLEHDWIQLDDNSDGVLNAITLPQLEDGPYLSYGIQWVAFGILIPLAVVWFIFAELRERRRDREEQEEALRQVQKSSTTTGSAGSARSAGTSQPDATTPTESTAEPASPAPAPTATADTDLRAQRLAQRYGDSGHRAGGQRRPKKRGGERF